MKLPVYKYSDVVNEGYPQYGKEKVLKEAERMPLIDECIRIKERYKFIKFITMYMDDKAPEFLDYRVEKEFLQNRFKKLLGKMPKEDRDLIDINWLFECA